MRIKEVKLYQFDELSPSSQDHAISHLSDINVDSDFWFDCIIDEAKELGLNITEWDLYHRSIKGSFTKSEEDVAKSIKKEHGESCETYHDAVGYLKELESIQSSKDDEPDTEAIDEEFLHSLLQDYLSLFNKEYEYQTSKEAIIETIKANEYEFTEEGDLE